MAGAAGIRDRLRLESGAVALTFDDGPDPVFTPLVLDRLAELEVTATFFLVGDRARDHPALVRRIVADGHALGSHSRSHPDPWELSLSALLDDYRQGRRAVEQASGRTVRLFRPPKGHVDAAGVAAMRIAGLRPWLWSLDPEDWSPGATASGIAEGVRQVAPGDVVLLHDALAGPGTPAAAVDRRATVEALPSIVHIVRQEGLALVTLS